MLDEGHRRADARHRRRGRASSRPTAAPHTARAARRASRSCRAATVALPRQRRSPRWTSTRCSPGAPEVALVDELAHTNVPGLAAREALAGRRGAARGRHRRDHARSTSSTWSRSTTSSQAITGVPQRETVPDAVVRAADQVELVDMTPGGAAPADGARQHLRAGQGRRRARRTTSGAGNLTALRELALLWLADSVDDGLQRYREQHGIAGTWETRERVVVALTGGPGGRDADPPRRPDRRPRQRRRPAGRARRPQRRAGRRRASPRWPQQRLLVESLGGSYHSVVGDDVPAAVLDFARADNATQIVHRRQPAQPARRAR